MPVYKSPRGDIYNLDVFAAFSVKGSMVPGPAGNSSRFQLEGHTFSGFAMIIHTGSEKECASVLNEIDRLLRLNLSGIVSLSEDTLSRLKDENVQTLNRSHNEDFVQKYIKGVKDENIR